jgi:hypothetical protein
MKRSQGIKLKSHVELPDHEELFIKKIPKELIVVLSDGWLEESELSPKIIWLDTPSVIIQYQLNSAPSDTFII